MLISLLLGKLYNQHLSLNGFVLYFKFNKSDQFQLQDMAQLVIILEFHVDAIKSFI